MDQFICLRMIQMNGVDLARFQFDYDMSFAVIFMNADGMIYGRFGTRDAKPEEADRDISLEGMRAAMEAVLALHRNYPDNAASLVAKRGPTPRYPTAEQYPKMKEYTPQINYDNEVAKSCIHCHQIHDAERQEFRDAFQPVPPEILYPYPKWFPGVSWKLATGSIPWRQVYFSEAFDCIVHENGMYVLDRMGEGQVLTSSDGIVWDVVCAGTPWPALDSRGS